jgi:hydrogenase expression/formation protein HypC
MCLGIPMEIIAVNGFLARCQAKGIEREVNLFLLQDELPVPGDHVVVHVGYALQKITPQAARSVWETYDTMLALEAKADEA